MERFKEYLESSTIHGVSYISTYQSSQAGWFMIVYCQLFIINLESNIKLSLTETAIHGKLSETKTDKKTPSVWAAPRKGFSDVKNWYIPIFKFVKEFSNK